MTYPVPGYPLYVDGAYYPAALWRQFDGGTAVQDAGNAAAVSPAGGVFGDPASAMLVAPGGGMTVTVNAGYCSVPNFSGSGAYRFGLMRQATLGPVPAPGSGTRLDYVVASVSDTGSGSSSQVQYLTGTTSPPVLPANAIRLAEVAVPSTASSITSGMITDLRGFVAAPGCIVPVASAEVAPSGPTGQLFWDAATGQLLYSPVTEVTQELTGTGDWTCPAFVTQVAARATGGGGGGTGITSGSPGSATFTASGNWTAPAGVSAVSVQAWGAGASGGGSEHYYYGQGGGGGGGGGGFSSGTVPVTAGSSYTVTTGTGGAAVSGASSGNDGGPTVFTGDDGPSGTPSVITAGGGQRGFSSSAGSDASGGGAGGGGNYSGGSGGVGGLYDGAGGGGAAGTSGPGGSGGNPGADSPGAGGAGGGSGGMGGLTTGPGGNGQSPGGGGGGAGTPLSAGSANSGNGAGGKIILSWVPDSSGGGGGGGGEEAYEPAMAVTAGHSYAYATGTGGGDSADGTETSFTGDAVTLLASPGQATSQSATGGAGGTGSSNTQHFDGGAGGTGSAGTGVTGWGGGGGASGTSDGTGNAGGSATVSAQGAGGAAGPYGGDGGDGGSGGNGGNGGSPGGGGGGSSGESLGYSGGTGGPGSLVLSYTVAPGAIPYPLAGGASWYEYDPSTGTVPSVSVTITADGTSDYEITCQAAGTGAASGSTISGTLRILRDGTQVDAIDALASTGTPAAHYNAGWAYVTSGAQGTTLPKGTHVIEFTSSGVTMTGPASIRVAQVIA